jgi:hypothetical protein
VDTTAPRPATRIRSSPSRRTATEIDVAIRLVATGAAQNVRLCGWPGVARLAAGAATRARAAHVAFRVERASTGVVLNIGPRTAH